MENKHPEEQRLLVEKIRQNNEATLKKLYQTNYPKIENYILKNNGSVEQAKDVYQDAFLKLWISIKKNGFTSQNETAINGYLYTIAKNKWIDSRRANLTSRTAVLKDLQNVASNEDIEDITLYEIEKDTQLQLTMSSFNDLGDACKKVLSKFYFEKKTMQQLAKELQLTPASAKNKKYRCIQNLRELIKAKQ